MLALTLWQPYAHFIAIGEKRVENRDWRPGDHLLGQWIAIHAGKRYDREGARGIEAELGLVVPPPEELPQGAIVAVAVLDHIVSSEDASAGWDDPWFTGAFGWYLRDVTKIEPVPCKGRQQLWFVPGSVLRQVRANFRVARDEKARLARADEVRRREG